MTGVLERSSKREQSRREQRHVTASESVESRPAEEKLRHGDGGGNPDALTAVVSTRKRVAPKQGRGSTPHSQPDPSVTQDSAYDGSTLFNFAYRWTNARLLVWWRSTYPDRRWWGAAVLAIGYLMRVMRGDRISPKLAEQCERTRAVLIDDMAGER